MLWELRCYVRRRDWICGNYVIDDTIESTLQANREDVGCLFKLLPNRDEFDTIVLLHCGSEWFNKLHKNITSHSHSCINFAQIMSSVYTYFESAYASLLFTFVKALLYTDNSIPLQLSLSKKHKFSHQHSQTTSPRLQCDPTPTT